MLTSGFLLMRDLISHKLLVHILYQRKSMLVSDWTTRAKKHITLVSPFTDAFLQRRRQGQTHPVHDFLFTYYTFSPQKLKQWVPSINEKLIMTPETHEEFPWLRAPERIEEDGLLSLNNEFLKQNVLGIAEFVAELCQNIANRPLRLRCYGLHEWAMVYKSPIETIRHKGYKLRLSPEELARFVESQSICCSHYDAYRFFTDESRPMNLLKPTLSTRLQMEQGGCLHANMDLYKWSTKLWPWIGSDFIGQVFMLALEGRELDMRASPYDLREDGYEPICIETEEGRQQYQQEQFRYSERAAILRDQLRIFCENLLA